MVPEGTGSSAGLVDIYNAVGTLDVAVDVDGWFTDASNPAATGALYAPLRPSRICNTQSGSNTECTSKTLGPLGVLKVPVAGFSGIPSMSSPTPPTDVVVNVTAVPATGATSSYFRVYPDGSTPPGTSDLNFSAGQTVANLVVVQVGSDGMIDIFNSAGNEDAIVDVYGYYSTVKPDVTGLLDRDGYPASGYVGTPVSGYVVNVNWAALQLTENGPLQDYDTSSTHQLNPIDKAIQQVDAWNAANPTDPLHVKVRVWAGECAPAWAKDIGSANKGQPAFATTNSCASGDASPGSGVGEWWSTEYMSDYQNFQSQLAAQYDNASEIENVTISACMTEYSEPLLKDDVSVSALTAAGYTDYLDQGCEENAITNQVSAWKHTRQSFSFNPEAVLTPGSEGNPPPICSGDTGETFTECLMSWFAQTYPSVAALENNSIRYPTLVGSYPPMYTAMVSDSSTNHVPIDFQTATLDKLECNGTDDPSGSPCPSPATLEYGLSEALNWACSALDSNQLAASNVPAVSVELPAGYTSAEYPDPPTSFPDYDDFTTAPAYNPYQACVIGDPH